MLMPKGLLRALDPILAFAAGPARAGSAEFEDSFEAMLRGRPDGPLLLALWASISGGEIAHQDLREILRLMHLIVRPAIAAIGIAPHAGREERERPLRHRPTAGTVWRLKKDPGADWPFKADANDADGAAAATEQQD